MTKKKVIACEVVIDAMQAFLPDDVETETLPMSLHVNPKELRRKLQQRIDELDGIYDPIVLGFGLCSQATIGLQAAHSRLVIARTDDCIGIFLGSRASYRQQMAKEPGTYFLTCGWAGANSGTPFNEYERSRERWGAERAKRLLKTMLRHYRRLVYINTAGKEAHLEAHDYARGIADKHSLHYEELEGQTDLIKKLIHGPWDDDCVLVPPGKTVKLEDFMTGNSAPST